MYLLKIVVFLLGSFLLPSCVGVKNSPSRQKKIVKTENKKLTTTFRISAFAKFFLLDLNKALSKQDVTIEDFKPSEEFLKKYPLNKSGGKYLVRGFVKTNSHFNSEECEKYGISTGRPIGGQMTISIPLKSFEKFLNMTNIEYFEMNPRTKLR